MKYLLTPWAWKRKAEGKNCIKYSSSKCDPQFDDKGVILLICAGCAEETFPEIKERVRDDQSR
jgi:hypothetical protein